MGPAYGVGHEPSDHLEMTRFSRMEMAPFLRRAHDGMSAYRHQRRNRNDRISSRVFAFAYQNGRLVAERGNGLEPMDPIGAGDVPDRHVL